MKVHNLTDIETPELKQHGFLSQTFAVGNLLLAPGESADVDEADTAMVRRSLEHLVEVGAFAIDDLPTAYRTAREAAAKNLSPATLPRPDPPKRKE